MMICMAVPKKLRTQKVVGILALLIVTLLPGGLTAQDDGAQPEKLLVAVIDLPPFAMKTADGRWEGLGIDLWRAVADDLGVAFELREYDTIGQLKEAFLKDEIDVTPVASVTPDREIYLDFSNHYYRSGVAIAVRAERAGYRWLRLVDRIFSLQFLTVIGSMVLLWSIAGTLVWLFEGRRNRQMFGDGPVKGLGQGIWWAAVTMTTVGYGDKAPMTLGGRIVAIIWMVASIILISSFTAAITTSLTVSELSGKVRGLGDLPTVRVGSVVQSEAQRYLAKNGIAAFSFKNERDGLQALVDAKIDAFVFDESVLKYLARTQFPARVHVLPETFDHYFVSMAMPQGSPLREPLNRVLLRAMEEEDWRRLKKRYFGSGG
jgi:ABC-type amino acid transport substrate-binding protein